MSAARLGFIGMGLMGVPMSTRLLEAGFSVTVWNRNPAKCEPLRARGARVAASVAALVADCDIVMTCVSDTGAVQELVFGGADSRGSIAANGRADHLIGRAEQAVAKQRERNLQSVVVRLQSEVESLTQAMAASGMANGHEQDAHSPTTASHAII